MSAGLSTRHQELAEYLSTSSTRPAMSPERLRELLTHAVIVLCWGSTIVPPLLQSLTAPKYRVSVGEETTTSAIASLANLGFSVGLLGIAALVFLLNVRSLPTGQIGLLVLALTPWIYQVLRDTYSADPPKVTSLTYPVIFLVVWLLQPRWEHLATLGRLIVLTAAISILMGLLVPEAGILRREAGTAVSPEKELLPIGLLIGPFASGNNLGQFLVLGLPAAMLLAKRWSRVGAALVIIAALVWTSSRSSLAALVIGGLVALVLALLPLGLRRIAAFVPMVGAVALVVVLPLITHDPGAFTNRGLVWSASLERWREHVWLGNSSRFYSQAADYADSIASSAFHGHNQFVQSLTIGGVINVVLLGVLFAVVIAMAARWTVADPPSRVPVVLITMLFVCGTLEVGFSVVHRSYTQAVTVLPIAFILFANRNRPAPAEEEPEPKAPPEPERPAAWPELGPLSRPLDLAAIEARVASLPPASRQGEDRGSG